MFLYNILHNIHTEHFMLAKADLLHIACGWLFICIFEMNARLYFLQSAAEPLVTVVEDIESPYFDFTNNPEKCRTAGKYLLRRLV